MVFFLEGNRVDLHEHQDYGADVWYTDEFLPCSTAPLANEEPGREDEEEDEREEDAVCECDLHVDFFKGAVTDLAVAIVAGAASSRCHCRCLLQVVFLKLLFL